MARSITGERGALHALRVIKSDWTAVIMRNGGCVPGSFYQSCLSSEQRKKGLFCSSPFLRLQEQTTSRRPAGLTHTITFTHSPLFVGMWGRERAQKKKKDSHTSQQPITWIVALVNVHTHARTHANYIRKAKWHKHATAPQTRHVLHVFHRMTFRTFLS